MGFDYYCSISVRGDLIQILKQIQNDIIQTHSQEWNDKIAEFQLLYNKLNDDEYFSGMKLTFDTEDYKFKLDITDWNNDAIFSDQTSSQYDSYFEYMTIDRLLNTNINIPQLFNESDQYKIKNSIVIIPINFFSSYKGREKVDVDYESIAHEIDSWKRNYHFMKSCTKLGAD